MSRVALSSWSVKHYSYNKPCFILIIIDGEDMVCLELLLRLLHPRGLAKNGIFLKHIEVC